MQNNGAFTPPRVEPMDVVLVSRNPSGEGMIPAFVVEVESPEQICAIAITMDGLERFVSARHADDPWVRDSANAALLTEMGDRGVWRLADKTAQKAQLVDRLLALENRLVQLETQQYLAQQAIAQGDGVAKRLDGMAIKLEEAVRTASEAKAAVLASGGQPPAKPASRSTSGRKATDL